MFHEGHYETDHRASCKAQAHEEAFLHLLSSHFHFQAVDAVQI